MMTLLCLWRGTLKLEYGQKTTTKNTRYLGGCCGDVFGAQSTKRNSIWERTKPNVHGVGGKKKEKMCAKKGVGWAVGYVSTKSPLQTNKLYSLAQVTFPGTVHLKIPWLYSFVGGRKEGRTKVLPEGGKPFFHPFLQFLCAEQLARGWVNMPKSIPGCVCF